MGSRGSLLGQRASRRARRAIRERPGYGTVACVERVCRPSNAAAACPSELERLFKRLREASSLEAAREEMLTLFALGVPDTFNKPLLSTNSIENSIRNMRRLPGRVTRWRAQTDMTSRWMASAMLEAEKGFRRIQGYRQMGLLIEALNSDQTQEKKTETALLGKEEGESLR